MGIVERIEEGIEGGIEVRIDGGIYLEKNRGRDGEAVKISRLDDSQEP